MIQNSKLLEPSETETEPPSKHSRPKRIVNSSKKHVEFLPIQANFTHSLYPDILTGSLYTQFTTDLIDTITEKLRPLFLKSKIVLLSPANVCNLHCFLDGTNQTIKDGKSVQAGQQFLQDLSDFPVNDIQHVRGCLFSNTIMAEKKTLNYLASKKQCQCHFLYFDLSIETSSLFVLDSLNDSFSNSAFFSEPACKSFFNYIVRCVTFQKDQGFSARRGLKSLAYKKKSFHPTST